MPETPGAADNLPEDDSWRLFVAVDLPSHVRDRLAEAIERLRGAGWRARWVRPEGSHLTLKFYGSVLTGSVPSLEDALRQAVVGVPPFDVEAAGAGAFPNARRPRVLWIGVGGNLPALARLQDAVERASAALGFPPEERAFQPHLTIGRVSPEDLPAMTRIPERLAQLAELPPVPIPVDGVTLYRSQLSRGGAVYTALRRFPLDGGTS